MSAGFKYLDLSALPDDWTADHFGNLVAYNLGRTPPRNSPVFWKDGIYPWVSISDMKPYGVIQETVEKVSQQAFDEVFRGRLALEGSLLMSFKLTIGRISCLGVPAFHNEAIISFKPDPKKISPEYLGYYLSQINYKDYQDTAIKGQTLNKGKLDSLEISLPPLPEQKAIAHTLATVQRAIRAQERIIQTTTELKQALMQKLFSEGLRGEPQKETEIGLVPESWGVVPLSDVCRFQSGGTPSKQNPDFWQGTIPWASPKDMKRPRLNDVADHISIEALESGSKLAPAGSVFVVVRGMILAKTVPVALATVPMAINQDMKAIVPGAELRSDFLLYALEAFRESMFKKVGRSGHGTATLMGYEVAAFKIPLPDMQTQEEIASAFENIERKKELHEQKHTSIQALFGTLLHELMAAKTRVNQLNLNTELIP
jgi:type I restriction enzyme S subunit